MSSGAPNQYFFRGVLQSDKGFIWQSNSNLDVALYDAKEFKLIIPVGFWFSVQPGDKAKTGKGPAAWYESRLSGGIAAEGNGYRTDLRLVVYSSPNGSFEDVYELLLKVDLFDDVLFAKDSDTAFFRGFFPSITLANELKGARDGRDSGLFAEFALAPRARLLASKDVWIDAVVPLAIGLGLSKYYQLVDRGDTTPTDHVLGYASGGLFSHRAPVRSRSPWQVQRTAVAHCPVADGSQGCAPTSIRSSSSPRSTACCASDYSASNRACRSALSGARLKRRDFGLTPLALIRR